MNKCLCLKYIAFGRWQHRHNDELNRVAACHFLLIVCRHYLAPFRRCYHFTAYMTALPVRLQRTTELAQTLACSLILSMIDYCNAVLHGAPSYSIKKLQRVQNNAARIALEAPRRSHASPLLRTLHWLPVQQRIEYKVALLTFKVLSTSTPSYLQLLIQDREHGRHLRSTTTLCQPFTTITFAKRAFRCSAPAVWNSLPKTVLSSDSVAIFKSRLKTFLFSQAFSSFFVH